MVYSLKHDFERNQCLWATYCRIGLNGKRGGRTVLFEMGKDGGGVLNPPPPPVGDGPELVFVNVYGAQESIPKNRLRQAMEPWLAGIRQIVCIGPPGWGSIPGLLKRFTNTVCSTTGKPTRSFATERVSLDSV
jgi:hypothetical protein